MDDNFTMPIELHKESASALNKRNWRVWVAAGGIGIMSLVLAPYIHTVMSALTIQSLATEVKPSLTPIPAASFPYMVKVQDKISGKSLPAASVTLELPSETPRITHTDSNGYARFLITEASVNVPATLIIEFNGYKMYTQVISVTKNDFPQAIQLAKHTPRPQAAVTPIGEQLLPHVIKANQSPVALEKSELSCQGWVIGINGIKLNRVRVIPAEHSPSKAPVEGRTPVTIMETSNLEDGRWYRIEYGDGLSGWIHAKHISTAEHCLN